MVRKLSEKEGEAVLIDRRKRGAWKDQIQECFNKGPGIYELENPKELSQRSLSACLSSGVRNFNKAIGKNGKFELESFTRLNKAYVIVRNKKGK